MYSEDERREPLRELLREALPEQDAATNEEVAALSGTQLRDRLIAHSPLDTPWIKRVNQARNPASQQSHYHFQCTLAAESWPSCCRGADQLKWCWTL